MRKIRENSKLKQTQKKCENNKINRKNWKINYKNRSRNKFVR